MIVLQRVDRVVFSVCINMKLNIPENYIVPSAFSLNPIDKLN